MSAVSFENVSIVFGDSPETALPLMDQGLERGEIQQKTAQVLGVHDCTLSVEPGEILVLMGLSGSGKSTLLRAVNGLNPVVRGAVKVKTDRGEVNVSNSKGEALRAVRRSEIAMVFQQFGLLPWRTVRENVGLGLELAGMSKTERRAQVDKQLDLVGLSDWSDRKVGELSGGMRKRVDIGRVYANDPDVLLMDERFGALDIQTRILMLDLLADIWNKFHPTIIFVTHDISEAVYLGDDIYIMKSAPSRFVEHIKVDLPLKRTRETNRDQRFVDLVREVEDRMVAVSLMG